MNRNLPDSPYKILEEISLNAWPSMQQRLYDGWILRFARGYTRRANSVNPLYAGSLNVADKIRHCEQIYQAAELNTVFKITPFIHPANLDRVLAQAGYQKDASTSVQILDLTDLDIHSTTVVEQWSYPAEDWIRHYVSMNGVAKKNLPALRSILNTIAPATCFVTLLNQGQVVSCGLGVLDDQYVGLFDIVTDPTFRSRGFGTHLILNVLSWGKAQGAHTAYLQVMLNNEPALNLYAKLGFEEVYRYWYRIKP